ncbi:response regulator, partial [Nocardioides stalactiti]|uniref:response regulator n=1 Tax=Nocardioides stalactiti TaxID=2755356 RepID=UPI00160355AD
MIRVLVVDDDFMVARIHAAFVERTDGFEVAGTARTGAEALEMVGSLAPDLVLLDVHLPDLSGIEVLERLRSRADGDAHSVAVVMVTAERGAAAVRAALHGGAMQYLVKPFEYDDLADRLRQVAAALAR